MVEVEILLLFRHVRIVEKLWVESGEILMERFEVYVELIEVTLDWLYNSYNFE